MATDEVAVRLSLKDRARFSTEAKLAARDVRGIGDSADLVNKRSRLASGGMAVMRKGISGIISVAKMGAVAIGGLAIAAGAAGAKSLQLATDAAETSSKFHTVFKGMEEDVSSFVTQVNADYGIPTKELQDAASTFGVFGKSAGIAKDDLAGFSTDLTQAGLDLASFYNADPGEVFQNLRSGLAGEAEPMRKFGVFMSDASLNAFMLKEGMSGVFSELSEGEKVAVRQKFILASMGDAQNDLARTSDSMANQWRALKGRGQELMTMIGTGLMPVATKLVQLMNNKLSPIVTKLTEQAPNLATALDQAFKEGDWQGVAEVLDNIAGNTGKLIPKIKGLVEVGKAFGGEGGGFIQGINQIKEQFPGLEPIISKIQEVVGDLVQIWTDGLYPAFQDISDILPDVMQPMKLLDNVLGFIADNAKILHPLIVGLTVAWATHKTMVFGLMLLEKAALGIRVGMAVATGQLTVAEGLATLAASGWTAAQTALNFVLAMNPIGLVVIAIALLVAGFIIAWKKSEGFRDAVVGAWGKIKDAFGAAVDWVKEKWNAVVGFFREAPGKISALARGMWDGIKDAFRDVINFIIRGWNNLEFAIPSFDPPGPIGKIGGFTLGVPDIPYLHSGGTVTQGGTVNMRPDEELVVLPPAASVIPLEANVETGGGRGGWPETVQLVVGSKVLAEVTLDELRDKQARR